MNLILLSVMLVLASSQISFAEFGSDLLTNIGNFADRVTGAIETFVHGAGR